MRILSESGPPALFDEVCVREARETRARDWRRESATCHHRVSPKGRTREIAPPYAEFPQIVRRNHIGGARRRLGDRAFIGLEGSTPTGGFKHEVGYGLSSF